jgi:hypothetical protein
MTMSDYVPTTEEVRARYNADEYGYPAALDDPCPEFDRWLAVHDAGIREAEAARPPSTSLEDAFFPGLSAQLAGLTIRHHATLSHLEREGTDEL